MSLKTELNSLVEYKLKKDDTMYDLTVGKVHALLESVDSIAGKTAVNSFLAKLEEPVLDNVAIGRELQYALNILDNDAAQYLKETGNVQKSNTDYKAKGYNKVSQDESK